MVEKITNDSNSLDVTVISDTFSKRRHKNNEIQQMLIFPNPSNKTLQKLSPKQLAKKNKELAFSKTIRYNQIYEIS